MPSTYTTLYFHIVFSTKHRQPLIAEPLREELYKYIGGIVRNHRGSLLEIGGIADHAHLFARFPADRSVAEMVRLVKANSSKWVNEEELIAGRFEWQTGYGAFTVSPSHKEYVQQYIRRQEAHHAKATFQEEFVYLLKKHGIEYDERYLWD